MIMCLGCGEGNAPLVMHASATAPFLRVFAFHQPINVASYGYVNDAHRRRVGLCHLKGNSEIEPGECH